MKNKNLSRILFFLAEVIQNYVILTELLITHYCYSGMQSEILNRILFFLAEIIQNFVISTEF
jgi:hypothetical protein